MGKAWILVGAKFNPLGVDVQRVASTDYLIFRRKLWESVASAVSGEHEFTLVRCDLRIL